MPNMKSSLYWHYEDTYANRYDTLASDYQGVPIYLLNESLDYNISLTGNLMVAGLMRNECLAKIDGSIPTTDLGTLVPSGHA